jgi:hypothetical protein
VVDFHTIPPQPIDASRANALRELYERGPLYRKYTYETQNTIAVVVDMIHLYCPVCRHDQPFGTVRDRSGYFQCRACQKYGVQFYVQFGESNGLKWMMKVGQYPPATERLPKELENRLSGSDLDLYQKALRSRTFGFGLASMAYLRRVVENRTNELLDLIGEAASKQGGAADVAQRVAEAKTSFQFEQKVELAGQILPVSLRPGGMNPLDALHDLASAGIHRLSEEECLDHFDTARTAFEYLFCQLQVDREAARGYVDAMHKLEQVRAQATKKAESREIPDSPSKNAV